MLTLPDASLDENVKLALSIFRLDNVIWLLGLVARFSLRVREVPGSIPGLAHCFSHAEQKGTTSSEGFKLKS